MTTGPMLGPGDAVPEICLPDTQGTPVSLTGLRGTPVALVFFPFAFSGTCTEELRELRDNRGELESVGVRVLGVSCDPVFGLRAWDDRESFGFDLLSDFWPHGAAARAFGIFDAEHGRAGRGSFLVDAAGIVRWSLVTPPGQARGIAAYREGLAAL